jgi:hypothetical protein
LVEAAKPFPGGANGERIFFTAPTAVVGIGTDVYAPTVAFCSATFTAAPRETKSLRPAEFQRIAIRASFFYRLERPRTGHRHQINACFHIHYLS